jgi:hypothetical protein
MKSTSTNQSPELRMIGVAALGWLLPGAGHIFIGERGRGIILATTIALTFWTGVAIGGVKNTVNPQQRSLWFLGQICAGGHTLAAWGWGRLLPEPPASDPSVSIAFGDAEEVSVVYTAICGMLNVLVLLDVLVRAERPPQAPPERGPRASPRRSTA